MEARPLREMTVASWSCPQQSLTGFDELRLDFCDIVTLVDKLLLETGHYVFLVSRLLRGSGRAAILRLIRCGVLLPQRHRIVALVDELLM